MKVYEKILEVLKSRGVRRIFAVPGDAINPLVDAARRDDDIDFIHVSHEESGALAASAAAKLTGSLQVCASTVGPGSIHLLNGLYDAKMDRAPVLALVGQVATEYLGTGYHQEVDLPALFNDVADYLVELRNPAQLPHIAEEACNRALAGGVSVMVMPHDVASGSAPDLPVASFDAGDAGRFLPADHLMTELQQMLEKAARPCLLIGEGARDCASDLIDLAEHLSAPIIYSLRGRDILPQSNPWIAGGLGLLGTRGGVVAMKECDLLLMLGSDFPYRHWYNTDCRAVQVDRRAEVLGRRRAGMFGIQADAGEVVRRLLHETAKRKPDDGYLENVRNARENWNKLMCRQESLDRSSDLIHPQAAVKMIGELADDDAIFTCDTGEVTVWGARHLPMKPGRRFSLSFNLASMAYAMPAAIGAQLQHPGRQVISISGDGGFNMLMGDFLTAVKYQLPIKVCIVNNGKLGLIKMEQEVEGYPECETDLQNPDYVKLADAMGGRGFRATRPDELEPVLREAFKHEGPVIVDLQVNPDEITWPPKIQLGQAIGFGLAKFRELLCDC